MSSVWTDGLTVFGRAQFYGPYGRDSWKEWGNLHIFFLVSVAAALLVAWRRRDRPYPSTLLVLGVIGAMLLIPVLVAPASDHSFASTFLGTILAVTLVSVDYLMRTLDRIGCWAIAAVALLISLPVAWPLSNSNYYSRYSITETELRQLSSTYGRIVDVMVASSHQEHPGVVVFFDNDFAPHPNLAIGYYQMTGRFPKMTRVDDLAVKSWLGQLSEADFALTFVPIRIRYRASPHGCTRRIRYHRILLVPRRSYVPPVILIPSLFSPCRVGRFTCTAVDDLGQKCDRPSISSNLKTLQRHWDAPRSPQAVTSRKRWVQAAQPTAR